MTAAPTTTHTLHTGEWLELRREGHWEYAHRTGGHRAVMIIAVTDDDELVFVEQPRIPVHARTIEIPAGLVGDTHASDTPHEAARRELLEETGFEAARLEEIAQGCASAGMTDEHIHVFFATGLRRVHGGGGVDNEEIRVHVVPRATAMTWLEARRADGLVLDIKVFSALSLATHHLPLADAAAER
ncbi:MAG: NUDIX hydrolase [Nannocystaceae bacterium]